MRIASVRCATEPQPRPLPRLFGFHPLPLSPDEFDALMKKEIAANLALAKAAGLKFN